MFDRIEEYVSGLMNADDMKLFEAQMLIDNSLASSFTLYKAIEQQMRSKEQFSSKAALLRITLDKTRPHYFKTVKNENHEVLAPSLLAEDSSNHLHAVKGAGPSDRQIKVRSRWLMPAVAAAIFGAVILSITWFLYDKKNEAQLVQNDKRIDSATAFNNQKIDSGAAALQNQTQPQKPFGKDYDSIPGNKPEIAEGRPRNKPSNAKEKTKNSFSPSGPALYASVFNQDTIPQDGSGALASAFTLYNNKDYHNAIEAFDRNEKLVKRGFDEHGELNRFYAHYYKGQSYLALDSVAEALRELQSAIELSPNRFSKSKAQWYAALIYLKTSNYSKAKPVLATLSKSTAAGAYKLKALNLLKQLKGGE
jgi:tetratricopeptide (TPR) repeat protein